VIDGRTNDIAPGRYAVKAVPHQGSPWRRSAFGVCDAGDEELSVLRLDDRS
jgi:hypothetical protein